MPASTRCDPRLRILPGLERPGPIRTGAWRGTGGWRCSTDAAGAMRCRCVTWMPAWLRGPLPGRETARPLRPKSPAKHRSGGRRPRPRIRRPAPPLRLNSRASQTCRAPRVRPRQCPGAAGTGRRGRTRAGDRRRTAPLLPTLSLRAALRGRARAGASLRRAGASWPRPPGDPDRRKGRGRTCLPL